MTDQMTKSTPIEATPITCTESQGRSAEATSTAIHSPGAARACPCSTRQGSRVAQLAAAAEEAAQIRALTTRRDVVALRVDQARTQVDALLWAGIVLGLLFTAVNVQQFAAAGAPIFSTGWWVAWLLDPMVSLVLLAVLRAEQVTARYQVTLGTWPRRAKWCAFGATYLMNTWTSWGLDGEALSVSGVVLHSVPPLLVVLSAETGPALRDRLTEAARRALTDHSTGHVSQPTARPPDVPELIENSSPTTGGAVHAAVSQAVHGVDSQAVHGDASQAVHEPASRRGAPQVRESPVRERPMYHAQPGSDSANGQSQPSRRPRPRTPVPRRLLADYLAEARAALADAAVTGQRPDPTPAWCRQTTGCSAGTSVKLAAALRAATDQPADRPADGGSRSKPADVEGESLTVDHIAPEVAA